MAFDQPARGAAALLRFGRGERLTTVERMVVVAITGVIITLDAVGIFFESDVDLLPTLVSIGCTAVFVLYLWSPLIASSALGAIFVFSFVSHTETQVMTTAAMAVGMVMRLGWTTLVWTYTGAFVAACALMTYDDTRIPINVGIYLIFATVAGAVGFALRQAFARGRRLEVQLEQRAEQERQAVLAERRWIAGELHDSIAHHLTIVALHVQMLEDPATTDSSREAIRVAARKAMADLRFVIDLADDGPRSAGMQTGDLAAAIDEARQELESAGHPVIGEGDVQDERISRAAEIVLARIVRESATNILKYAGDGDVLIRLDLDDDVAELTIRSPLSASSRSRISSSSTGLARMAERVIGARGDFSAGEVEGSWVVSARLPIA